MAYAVVTRQNAYIHADYDCLRMVVLFCVMVFFKRQDALLCNLDLLTQGGSRTTEVSNLLDHGARVHSACAMLVRVIVHTLFWHIISLPDLSSLQSYAVYIQGLHAHGICRSISHSFSCKVDGATLHICQCVELNEYCRVHMAADMCKICTIRTSTCAGLMLC